MGSGASEQPMTRCAPSHGPVNARYESIAARYESIGVCYKSIGVCSTR